MSLSYNFVKNLSAECPYAGIYVPQWYGDVPLLGILFTNRYGIMDIIFTILRHFAELWISFSGNFHDFRNRGPDFHSICAIMAFKILQNLRNNWYQSFGQNCTCPSDDKSRYSRICLDPCLVFLLFSIEYSLSIEQGVRSQLVF